MSENIWIAASDGRLDHVQEFVAGGVSVNSKDESGYSPLTAAVSYSHVDLAKWLLDNGADANIRDEDGDTPLHQCEDAECAKLLIEAGADLFAENGEGKVPYVVAKEDHRKDVADYLAKLYEEKGKPLPEVEVDDDDDDDEEDDDEEEDE
jgi:uncharacterized protein